MNERKKQDRLIRIKVLDLQDNHCESCEIKQEFKRKYSGVRLVQKTSDYCLNDCSIGLQLQDLGAKLFEKRPVSKAALEKTKGVVKVNKGLTKEIYLQERIKGKSNVQIEREHGLKTNYIYAEIKKWGLSAKEVNRIVEDSKKPPMPHRPVAEKPVEVIDRDVQPVEEPASFIAATVERDQQIVEKVTPKKSGRSLQIEVSGDSESVEKELDALCSYVAAMPVKGYRLEISLREVDVR